MSMLGVSLSHSLTIFLDLKTVCLKHHFMFCLHVRVRCLGRMEINGPQPLDSGCKQVEATLAHLQQVLSLPICVWRIHISSM